MEMRPPGDGEKMTEYGNKIVRVLWPLLLHTVISTGVAFAAGILKDMNYLPGASGTVLDGTDATLVTVVSAAVSLPVFRNMRKRDRALTGKTGEKKRISVRMGAAAFFGGIFASCISTALMQGIGLEQYFSNRVQEELFSAGLLLQVIGLGLVVPVLEELLYRGILYDRLKEFLTGKTAAAAAALIFALAHGNMIQFLYALPMALILHWLCEKGGSLTLPILFHMGANLISVFGNAFFH